MIRYLFWFLLVLSGHALAETIPATASGNYWYADYPGCGGSSTATCDYSGAGNVACAARGTQNGWGSGSMTGPAPPAGVQSQGYTVTVSCQGSISYTASIHADLAAYVCPDSSYTLSGNQCTRPECPAGQIRKPDGTCGCPAGQAWSEIENQCKSVCDAYLGVENMEGLMIDPAKFQPYCDENSCAWLFSRASASSDGYVTDVLSYPAYTVWSKGGGLCSDQNVTGTKGDSKTNDTKPKYPPPCDASEGVLTSSSGKVACVPEGTPNAPKPKVSKSESRQTGPNGETITTEKTTTTDPNTGASHTSSTTTTTNPDGSSSSVNGVTESAGDGDNSGDEPGQCAKEPDSPLCKKGTVKEKGGFEEGQDGTLEAAKQQLSAKFDQIKSGLSAALSSSAASGSGALPCPAPVMVLGRSVSLCVNDYADKLSVIGSVIVFAASIIAILLVVTA